MAEPEHVDLLDITGTDRATFNITGDVEVVADGEGTPYGRVFRRGGKVVFRAGVRLWDDPKPEWH